MYMFTIDSTTYDETQLNMIQIEQLITKHRTLVGRIKKNQRYYEGNHEIRHRRKTLMT